MSNKESKGRWVFWGGNTSRSCYCILEETNLDVLDVVQELCRMFGWGRSSAHIYILEKTYTFAEKKKKNNLCAAHALLPVALNVSEHVLKSTLSEEAATPVW